MYNAIDTSCTGWNSAMYMWVFLSWCSAMYMWVLLSWCSAMYMWALLSWCSAIKQLHYNLLLFKLICN